MIRHFLSGATLALGLALALPAAAQSLSPMPTPAPVPAPLASVSPSHLAIAKEVVISSGLSLSFDSIFGEFRDRVRQIVGPARPEMQKDMEAVLDTLKPEADKRRDEVTTSSAQIFASRMTEADLKEIAAFFKSPVGQRYNAMRPQVIDEIFAVLQPWSLQTSNFLFDRFSEEMRKRGHQL